ncbi:hypothetical protein BJY04DRAFT_222943 [Aspergillus karnatakaensis]|uniref:TMEM53 family protein n=1 Tax=Aspergillus karnatakaensis TaxID=1810916 RepID=UPI003CCCB272
MEIQIQPPSPTTTTTTTSPPSTTPKPIFPDFNPLTPEIYTRPGLQTPTPNPTHPHTIIIFAWGDAQPKHIAKYAAGFRTLFPHAQQIAVLAPIYKALVRTMAMRIEAMKPIIEATYPGSISQFANSKESTEGAERQEEKDKEGTKNKHLQRPMHDGNVLVHVMSNTGGINYAAFLHAYRGIYGKPFPHKLVSLDSTPGSTAMTFSNLKRHSLAMALGTAAWFPWPMGVTQYIWAGFLYTLSTIENVIGVESAAVQSVNAVRDKELLGLQTRQLFLYGKADRIILWSDIEEHIAGVKGAGWEVEARLFEGSGHVEHMRRFGAEYWGAVREAWEGRGGRKVVS